MGEAAGDSRLAWLEERVKSSLHAKPDKFQKMLAADESR
jgi:hypothetical protein